MEYRRMIFQDQEKNEGYLWGKKVDRGFTVPLSSPALYILF